MKLVLALCLRSNEGVYELSVAKEIFPRANRSLSSYLEVAPYYIFNTKCPGAKRQ